MKRIILLGASGSIGSQTLEIMEKHREDFSLFAFSLGTRVVKIPFILQKFPEVKHICVRYREDRERLEKEYPDIIFHDGDEGLIELCNLEYDMAVNALVGFLGLLPSLTILRNGRVLALANKESLVVGGELINKALKEGHGKLVPIDSEHVAIAKMLHRVDIFDLDKIIITASGGPFFHKKRDELADITPTEALKHPSWSMGNKISIDSATMMNKGFEVIEALRLFPIKEEDIEILIQPTSNIHSILKMKDGAYLADISKPDMRVPIEWALYEGDVEYDIYTSETLDGFGDYPIYPFDKERFPMVEIALTAYRKKGTSPAILNASNEEAVYAFLKGKISFLEIEDIVKKAVEELSSEEEILDYEQLRIADKKAREFVKEYIERSEECR